MAIRRHYSNLAPATTTTGSLTASATNVTVATITGFPGVLPYTAAIERGTASEELVLVTAAVGTSLTITRGYGGTTGKTHSSGVPFEHVVDATDADEANAHVTANSGVHGVVGNVVGDTDTQTLTNKTLSSSRGLATATDPGLKTQANASGSAPQIQSLDSAGTTTVFQVSRTGALTALSASVTNAVSAASAAITGTVTAAAANLTGALSAASASISGLLTAGSANVTGTATVGSLSSGAVTATTISGTTGTFSGNITAPNQVAKIGYASGSATSSATGGEAKDTDVGDVTFTAVSGHKYRVTYHGRVQAVSGGASADLRIRDGGASSPTTGSTLLAGASTNMQTTGGPGGYEVTVSQLVTGLSAGTHKIAGFLAQTSGGTVQLAVATGGLRELYVYDEGTV